MTILDTAGCLLTHDHPRIDATTSVTDLLQLISEGHSTAWEEIFRRYGSIVVATVRSFRLQNADTLDAVQMIWLRLAENAPRVQHPQCLAGWLATTARRETLNILRHQTKHTLIPIDTAADHLTDPTAGPEQHVIHRETQRILNDLIAELPPRRRALLQALFTDKPQRYTEITRILRIPSGGIGPTRARALQQLRHKLHKLGLGPPGTTSADATRIAELERENRELLRANEILKAASAFMPTWRLCRQPVVLVGSWLVRSGGSRRDGRHNHRASRKARRSSAGR